MARNSFSQTQVQGQVQTQSLSPQQVLFARLLELTTVEVEDRVRGELMDNPALEATEPEYIADAPYEDEENAASSIEDYRSDDDVPPYNGWDYAVFNEIFAVKCKFTEHI